MLNRNLVLIIMQNLLHIGNLSLVGHAMTCYLKAYDQGPGKASSDTCNSDFSLFLVLWGMKYELIK